MRLQAWQPRKIGKITSTNFNAREHTSTARVNQGFTASASSGGPSSHAGSAARSSTSRWNSCSAGGHGGAGSTLPRNGPVLACGAGAGAGVMCSRIASSTTLAAPEATSASVAATSLQTETSDRLGMSAVRPTRVTAVQIGPSSALFSSRVSGRPSLPAAMDKTETWDRLGMSAARPTRMTALQIGPSSALFSSRVSGRPSLPAAIVYPGTAKVWQNLNMQQWR